MSSRSSKGLLAGLREALYGTEPKPWQAVLHLLALSGFALAQPIYDLFGKNVPFFVAHDSRPLDLVLLVILLSVAVPSLLALLEQVAGLVHRGARQGLHYAFLGLLAILAALPALKKARFLSDSSLLVLAALLGAVFLVAYARLPKLRDLLSILSISALVFPLHFLALSEARAVVFPEGKAASATGVRTAGASVVFVMFEELPIVSLMDEERQIDPVRYPNFAALARQSHWFRNFTVHAPATTLSVPAILTGRYIEKRGALIVDQYPESLFTLLGPGYRMVARGFSKNVVPADYQVARIEVPPVTRIASMLGDVSVVYLHIVLPHGMTLGLPRVTDDWRDFGFAGAAPDPVPEEGIEPADADEEWKWTASWKEIKKGEEFDSFLEALVDVGGPTVHYLHTKLVHNPWRLLPSGKWHVAKFQGFRMGWRADGEVAGFGGKMWSTDEWLVMQAYQRHLLELSLADRKLGVLFDRLEELGAYDESLIVVTSDHGTSFEPGVRNRGRSETIVGTSLAVPLFMKLPNQSTGVISDENIEGIDIVPTIADVLDIDIPWPVDGQSAFDLSSPRREVKTLIHKDQRLELDASGSIKYEGLAKKLAMFGSGRTRPNGYFDFGPHGHLVGQSLAEVPRDDALAGRMSVRLSPDEFAVDLETSEFLPAWVGGKIVGSVPETPMHLAIAVNGVVRAVTRTELEPPGDGKEFHVMLPEEGFRSGANEVEVFAILSGADERTYLAAVGRDG